MQVKSIDNLVALDLKILLLHYFSTFFSFYKSQLFLLHSQILLHLCHWDQSKQKAPSAHYISLNFLTPPCSLRTNSPPPIIWELRVLTIRL